MRVNSIVESLAEQYLKWWKRTSDGKNIQAACPFHHETSEGAFYMSLETGLYICHGCQARGSLPTFLREVGAPVGIRTTVMDMLGPRLLKKERPDLARSDPFKGHMPLNESLLGVFDYCPVDLVHAGFDRKVLRRYEVGFDKEAMRITFPLRNHLGVLMGIAGRTVVNEKPRYKIYKEQDLLRFSALYRGYDFHKKNFLWNFHNVYPAAFHGDLDEICVVEGYKAALWLIQNGFENTVAILGSYLSDVQRMLLQRLAAKIYILLDNTSSAQKGAYDAAMRLRTGNRVFMCEYPKRCQGGEQPDDLNEDELQTMFREAKSFNNWRIYHDCARSNKAICR